MATSAHRPSKPGSAASGPAAADAGGRRPTPVGVTTVDLELARADRTISPDTATADLAASVVGRLFRLSPRLVDVQDIGARDYGLGFARGRVLWALDRSGPVLMRALSQDLGVSPRTITGLVDALEADGWVTRGPHPADRRATVISLNPAAVTALARLRESYEGLAHDLLGDMPPETLARCREVLARIEERLDEVVSRRVSAFGPAPVPRSEGSG